MNELADIESNYNSIDSHIECSTTLMLTDNNDLQIYLNKFSEEKLFSLDTRTVTQFFTGKILHQDIIEINCQSSVRFFVLFYHVMAKSIRMVFDSSFTLLLL